MQIALILEFLFIIAFVMALLSMSDVHFADEVRKTIQKRKIKGSIVFFKDKITHYK